MRRNKLGFTIIETTLSMAFISVLLLMTAFLIIQMLAIYQKTLMIKAVNQTSQEIIDDMTRHIKASTLVSTDAKCSLVAEGARNACRNDNAFRFIFRQRTHSFGADAPGSMKNRTLPTNGIFCSGLYTFIWNTGYALNSNNNVRAKVNGRDDFRLIRVFDSGGQLCMNNVNTGTYAYDGNEAPSYTVSTTDMAELIDPSESDLALYDMRIFPPGRHAYSGQAFYAGTFILATLDGDVDILASGEYCKAPKEAYFDEFTYCALNKYNFASQATGETDD